MKKITQSTIRRFGDFGAGLFVALLSLNVFWTSNVALFGITIGFAMMLLSLLGSILVLGQKRKGMDRRWELAVKESLAVLFDQLFLTILVATIASAVMLSMQGLTLGGGVLASLMLISLTVSAVIRYRLNKAVRRLKA